MSLNAVIDINYSSHYLFYQVVWLKQLNALLRDGSICKTFGVLYYILTIKAVDKTYFWLESPGHL